MLRRLTTALMLAAAVFAVGCSDQPARATGPVTAPSLTIGVNDIRAMIDDLVPNAHNYQGTAQGSFGKVESAINGGGTGEAEALAFQQLILGYYDQGVLLLPDGFDSIEDAVVSLMNAVFTYAGLPNLVIPPAPSDPNAEFVIDIVTDADYDANNKALVKTNFGNAAMIVAKGDFAGPVILSIIEKQYLDASYVFPLPPGIQKIAKTFEYTASSEILGASTVLSICDALEVSGPAPKWLLHDTGGEFAEKRTPDATGHACPADHSHANAARGGSFWARGLNAAGSLVESVLLPKPAYASHSLAHAIIVDELSPWTVGQDLDNFTVKIVRVKTPGSKFSDTKALFPKQGALVLWLEIRNHDVVQTCGGGRLLTDVEARPTATAGGPVAVGTWTTASRCEAVDGTSGWVFEMSNPRNNKNSSGVIDVRVTGAPATPQLTYDAKL
jgi:hypothetical protein